MPEVRTPIQFGTDGWRGVIADAFTFSNVKKVSSAIAAFLKEQTAKTPLVVIGYDTRFLSRRFAGIVGEVLSQRGCTVIISDSCVSTPAVSASVVGLKADCGIVLSASHNPPEYNGIKIKTANGCSASENITKRIEYFISTGAATPPGKSSFEYKNLTTTYLSYLRSLVDFNLIKRKHTKVLADPMYGAAIGYMETLLKKSHCTVHSIHNTPDPLFGGLHPEPIEENLAELKRAVKQTGADIGLATDGDADRLGVVDEKGRYYPPQVVFPLLLHYLCRYKKMTGKVVQTISLGYLSERIAKNYNLPFEEVPVGFKYIAEKIMHEKALIGGEESGGYGYGNGLPERDGILNALMLIEMLAYTGKSLSALRKEIEQAYGTSAYLRTDFQKPPQARWTKDEFVKKLKALAPAKIGGKKVVKIKDFDGIEFVLEDDSWLLLRPSGTEPVIRVYSESPTLPQTKRIITTGSNLIQNIP